MSFPYFARGPSVSFVPRGAIAQLAERLDRTQEVAGSTPASSIPVQGVEIIPGMGKLAAGILLALSLLVVAVPVAGAAEIPPTQKCVKVLTGDLAKYSGGRFEGLPAAEKQRVTDILFDEFIGAGCVSDIEPLQGEVELKPFSESCKEGAKAADEYWTAGNRRLVKIKQTWGKRIGSLSRRLEKVTLRLAGLRDSKASPKRIRKLSRVKKGLQKRVRTQARKAAKVVDPIARPMYYSSLLIIWELAARRCVSVSDLNGNETAGPAAGAIRRHSSLISALVSYMANFEQTRP